MPPSVEEQEPAPPAPGVGVEPIEGELVPTLNGYMRSRVFREVRKRSLVVVGWRGREGERDSSFSLPPAHHTALSL
jgi:hypothetical protein